MSKAKAQRTARPTLCGLSTPRSPALLLVANASAGSDQLSNQEQPKKKKIPIACAVRRMHEGMEIMFAFDRDKSFLPSPNELMQFELVHKQITGHHAMSLIIIQDMRERAKKRVADECDEAAASSSVGAEG
jgi:hypothetical protein